MTGLDTAQLAIASFSAGGGFALSFVVVRWTANFIAGRLDRKEAVVDAGTKQLLAAQQKQIDALSRREEARELRLEKVEAELEDCRDQHAQCKADVMRLEAILQGYGDAGQIAQLKTAADKLTAEKRG